MKTVSVAEMKELDRKTIEDYGVPSIILMENAGRCVAEEAINMLGGASGKKVSVFCGIGNNGGDGFVVARYLARSGAKVDVFIIGQRHKIKNDPRVNLKILEKIGVPVEEIASPVEIKADIIIDAIFGVGLKGEVKEPARSIIKGLNETNAPILSVDVPSGLDADTGEVLGEAIRAEKTVTMHLPKIGFYLNKGPEYTGEVEAADIGIIKGVSIKCAG